MPYSCGSSLGVFLSRAICRERGTRRTPHKPCGEALSGGELVVHFAACAVAGPAADDVAHRQDAHGLATVDDDEMAEAAAHHRLGCTLERPVGGGEGQRLGEVVADLLCVRVLTGPDRVENVALRDDAGPRLLRVDDDRGADLALRHPA